MSVETIITNYLETQNKSFKLIIPEGLLNDLKEEGGSTNYNEILLEAFGAFYELKVQFPDHVFTQGDIYLITHLQNGLFKIFDKIERSIDCADEGVPLDVELANFWDRGCEGISDAIQLLDDVFSAYLTSDYAPVSEFLCQVLLIKKNIRSLLLTFNESIESELSSVVDPLVAQFREAKAKEQEELDKIEDQARKADLQKEICEKLGIPFDKSLFVDDCSSQIN